MGMGLGIEAITVEWPTEEVTGRCIQCGSSLKLTRFERLMGPYGIELPLPPEIAAQESEQLCPVCGAPACEEEEKTKGKSTKASDFFSAFRR